MPPAILLMESKWRVAILQNQIGRYFRNFLHKRYQEISSETRSRSVNSPGTCLFGVYLSKNQMLCSVKVLLKEASLFILLALYIHSIKSNNMPVSTAINVSERPRLTNSQKSQCNISPQVSISPWGLVCVSADTKLPMF